MSLVFRENAKIRQNQDIRKYISHKKTSAIRNYKSYNYNFEFMTLGVVGSGMGCVRKQIFFPRTKLEQIRSELKRYYEKCEDEYIVNFAESMF